MSLVPSYKITIPLAFTLILVTGRLLPHDDHNTTHNATAAEHRGTDSQTHPSAQTTRAALGIEMNITSRDRCFAVRHYALLDRLSVQE